MKNKIERDKSQIIYNTYGTPMKIVETIDVNFVLVEFLDQFHYQMPARYFNFTRGTVLNPYDRTICGVGYIGDGKYKGNVKNTPYQRNRYNTWVDMIRRCYDETIRYKNLAYQDCFVADIWHCYNNFAEWYDENYYDLGNERMHIDKDILFKNNRFYNPETCIIVPQRINMMFMTKARTKDLDLPQGIHRTDTNKFMAMYASNSIGTYESLEDAIKSYNKAKYKAICKVAEEYKNKIPPRLYDALINWIPDGISRDKMKLICEQRTA